MSTSIGEIFVRVGVDATGMAAGMTTAERTLERLGTRMYFLGSRITAGFSAPLAAAIGGIAKFGMDFDQAMTESLAIMDKTDQAMRSKMEKQAMALSEMSKFSATEVAKGYYHLASAGMNAMEQLASMPVVAKFAQAGMMDLAKSAELLSGAVTAMGMKTGKSSAEIGDAYQHVADVLTEANNRALGTIEDFALALSHRAGAQLRVYNKSVEEGVAALMAFASQNIKGAAAGQQLYMVLRDIGRYSVTHAKAWKDANITVWEAGGGMRDLGDIIMDLEKKLTSLSGPQRIATMLQLGFNQRTLASIQMLLGFGETIKDYEFALRKAGGATDEVARNQMQSLQNQMKAVWHEFQNAAIVLFAEFIPEIREHLIPWLRNLIGYVKDLTAWFHNLSPEAKDWVGVMAGVGIALGPAITALGGLTLLVRAALVPFSLLAQAIKLIAPAADAAQAAGIAAAAKLSGKTAAGSALGQAAASGLGRAAVTGASVSGMSLSDAAAAAGIGWGSSKYPAFKEAFLAQQALAAEQAATKVGLLTGAWRTLMGVVSEAAVPLLVVGGVLATLRLELGSWERVGNFAAVIAAPGATAAIGLMKNGVETLNDKIREYTGWAAFGSKASMSWTDVLTRQWEALKYLVSTWGEWLNMPIQASLSRIADLGADLASGDFQTAFAEKFGTLAQNVGGSVGDMLGWFGKLVGAEGLGRILSYNFSAIVDAFGNLWSGVKQMGGDVWNALVPDIWQDRIKASFLDPFERVFEGVTGFFDSVTEYIKGAAPMITGAFAEMKKSTDAWLAQNMPWLMPGVFKALLKDAWLDPQGFIDAVLGGMGGTRPAAKPFIPSDTWDKPKTSSLGSMSGMQLAAGYGYNQLRPMALTPSEYQLARDSMAALQTWRPSGGAYDMTGLEKQSPAEKKAATEAARFETDVQQMMESVTGASLPDFDIFMTMWDRFTVAMHAAGKSVDDFPSEEMDNIWKLYEKYVKKDVHSYEVDQAFADKLAENGLPQMLSSGDLMNFGVPKGGIPGGASPSKLLDMSPTQWKEYTGQAAADRRQATLLDLDNYYEKWKAKAADTAAELADIEGGIGAREAISMKARSNAIMAEADKDIDLIRKKMIGMDPKSFEYFMAATAIENIKTERDEAVAAAKKIYQIRVLTAMGWTQIEAEEFLKRKHFSDDEFTDFKNKAQQKLLIIADTNAHITRMASAMGAVGNMFTALGAPGVGTALGQLGGFMKQGSDSIAQLQKGIVNGNLADGVMGVAGAITTYAQAWSGAKSVEQRTLNTTMTGASMGFQLSGGNPLGAIIGGAIGFATSAFAGSSDDMIIQKYASDMGLSFSEALTNKIKSTATGRKDDWANAILYNLKGIIEEAGGLVPSNFDKFLGMLNTMVEIEKHGLGYLTGVRNTLREVFADYAAFVLKTGEIAPADFANVVMGNAITGANAKEVLDFVQQQVGSANTGLEGAIGATTGYSDYTGYADAITAAQEALAGMTQGTDEYIAKQAELNNLLMKQAYYQSVNISDLETIGKLMSTTYSAAVAAGGHWSDIIIALQPSLAKLTAAYKDLGYTSGNVIIEQLVNWGKLIDANKGLIDGISSYHQLFVAISTIGGVTRETFDSMVKSTTGMYNKLITAGFTSEESLRAIAPLLDDIVKSATQYGWYLDADTAALIQHAQEMGILQDDALTTNAILMSGLAAIITALGGTIPKAWEALLAKMGYGIDDLLNYAKDYGTPTGAPGEYDTGSGVFTDPSYIPPKWLPPNINRFATGGLVTHPQLIYAGERGPEAIVPWDRISDVLNRDGGGGTAIFVLDGREIARGIVPHIPGEVKRYGLTR